MNGMQFDRGADADYDAWGQLGNKGWDWKGLKPYFMKSNDFDAPSKNTTKAFGITYDDKAYGKGPLKVSIPDYQFPDMKTIFRIRKKALQSPSVIIGRRTQSTKRQLCAAHRALRTTIQ